ncbi:hypothetical protein HOP50_04g29580 [Chloropicon primus]|uniref:Uncharacterized protein n=2 Tax=Chloropicon primus TaxID=1764295 RepID=A0A5B8MJI6_9CHLO|nr:hypothetical protein A3770_04p29590 [Chloropicon primus]UPQ99650.1 hypothetical protein HOP50_04g29580 [Chloropicon primus]|eukprot:QDZ20441.1 hypothetical protein A3770_04p29590 [Chloropicon primus]
MTADKSSPKRAQRSSTFVKTQKRKTRTRSDRSSAFLSEKTSQNADVVLRINETEGEGAYAYYKDEGERYVGKKDFLDGLSTTGESPAKGTVKFVSGKRYAFSLALPSSVQIKELNDQGDKEVQVLKDDEEEAESVRVTTHDKSGRQCFEWTNTMEPCSNGQRQILRLSLVTEEKLKLTIPLMVKTYKVDAKGTKNGKPLLYVNYKFKPAMNMKYDLERTKFERALALA